MRSHQLRIVLIQVVILLFLSPLIIFSASAISNPVNPPGKIEFFKKNFEQGKKYRVNDNIELFKKVLIGKWAASPGYGFEFFDNGDCIVITYSMGSGGEEIRTPGKWIIKNNSIFLKLNVRNEWKKLEVDYYSWDTSRGPEGLEHLGFHSSFDIFFKNSDIPGMGISFN